MNWCPIQGESKTLIRSVPQKLEISTSLVSLLAWHRKKDISELNNLLHQVNLFFYFFSASLMFLKMSVQFSFQSLTFFKDIINQKHCFFNICFKQKCIKQTVSVPEHWNDFCLRFVQILRAKYFDLSLTKYIFLVFGKV